MICNQTNEIENGWYLRSDGYMTSEYSYQRIEAMKGNRALDNHQKLVFVEFMGGEETDSRVYFPNPGTCEFELNTEMTAIRCDKCGYELPKGTDLGATRFCGGCRRAVKR